MIKVEVAYALPDKQTILVLNVADGATVETVIKQSGILDLYPDIDLLNQQVGIFSKQCALTDIVKENDRIEVYRPLVMSPKARRRSNVKKG